MNFVRRLYNAINHDKMAPCIIRHCSISLSGSSYTRSYHPGIILAWPKLCIRNLDRLIHRVGRSRSKLQGHLSLTVFNANVSDRRGDEAARGSSR
jgi:hypothetical protein